MKENRVIWFILAAEFLLLVPLSAMLFTDAVDWDMLDFIIAAGLLAGVGYAFSLIMNRTRNSKKTFIGLALAGLVLLIWAELAVGIFGTPLAGS